MKGGATNLIRFFVILFWVLFFSCWILSADYKTNFIIKSWENAMISFPEKLKEINFSQNKDFNVKTLSGSTWINILSNNVSEYSPLRGYFVNNYGDEDLVISYKIQEKIRNHEKIISHDFSKWWNLIGFTSDNAQKNSIKLNSLSNSENYEKIIDFTADIFWENQNTLKFWNVRSTVEKSNFVNTYVQKNKSYAVYLNENISLTGSQSATNSDGSLYNQTLVTPILDLWSNEIDQTIHVWENNSAFDFQIKSGSGSDIFIKNISIYNSWSLNVLEYSNILSSVDLISSSDVILSTLSWSELNKNSFDFSLSDYELLKGNSEIFSVKLNTNPSYTGSVQLAFWIKEIIAEDIDFNQVTNLQHSTLWSNFWFSNKVTVKAIKKWVVTLTQTWAVNNQNKVILADEKVKIADFEINIQNEDISFKSISVTFTGAISNEKTYIWTTDIRVWSMAHVFWWDYVNKTNSGSFWVNALFQWNQKIELYIAPAHIWFEKFWTSHQWILLEKLELGWIKWVNSNQDLENIVLNWWNGLITITPAKITSSVQSLLDNWNAQLNFVSNYWINTQSGSSSAPTISVQKLVFQNNGNADAWEYTLRKQWTLSSITWSLVNWNIEFDLSNYENNSFKQNNIYEIIPEWNADKIYGLILKKDGIHYSTDADNTGIIFQSQLDTEINLGTKIY